MSMLAVGAMIGTGLAIKGVGHLADTGKRKRLRGERERFDEQMDAYQKSEFQALDREALKRENIFEGQENIFANQENIFEGQENIMEDIEVDTQAVDYAKEQFSLQQANIMQGLRCVTGASGAAGLAGLLYCKDKINLNKDSIILIINTEGITDTLLYTKIINN